MKKSVLLIAVGFAAGYLVGARAGRERYEALIAGVNGVWRDRAQTVAKDVADKTVTVTKDLSDRTVAVAKDAAEKTTTAARDVRDRTITAATDVASRVGEARDNALEDFDDDDDDAS